MTRSKTWIFGSVPEPIGGITVTIERIVESYHMDLGGLVDPYFGKNKRKLPIEHVYPLYPGSISAFKVMTYLYTLRSVPLFIKLSTDGNNRDSKKSRTYNEIKPPFGLPYQRCETKHESINHARKQGSPKAEVDVTFTWH